MPVDRDAEWSWRGAGIALVTALAAFLAVACGGEIRDATTGAPPTLVGEGSMSAPPTSSPGGPGDWLVLFDGGSTEALRGYGRDEFPADRWVVDDGALRAIPGPGVDLVTRETYADFELEFEWKVAPGGNSGVIYRVAETDDPAWATGPEYQVLDDESHPDGRDPRTSAGALYGLRAPGPTKRLEPVGGFNRGRIVIRDGHVEHWLNGELVVEYEWDGADIRAEIDRSKFAGLAGFMRQASGHIAFQHHGEEAWLRAMRIRPLDGASG